MTHFRRTLLVAAALAVLSPWSRESAWACDSTACAVAMRNTEGGVETGAWRVDVSARHVDQSRRLSGSDSAAQVYRPRIDLAGGAFETASHQELAASMTFLQIEVSRGLTGGLSAYATLPLYRRTVIDSLHVQAPVADDTPLPPGHDHSGVPTGASVEVRNRASGMGDLQFGLRQVAWSSGSRQVTAGITVKLPTGSSEVADVDGVVDPMMQPGTGAADFVGSLQYGQKMGSTALSVTASMQKATRSDAGYRYGDDAVLAFGASRPLSPRLTGQLLLKGQRSGRHRFRDAGVPSTGLAVIQVSPGVRFRLRPDVSLYGTMQIPAYVRVNESQLGPRATLTAGFVKAF